MVALDRTTEVRYRNFGRPGTQLWGVRSADGQWYFERLEQSGTPWVVMHSLTLREVGGWYGTLRAARIGLQAELDAGTICAGCGVVLAEEACDCGVDRCARDGRHFYRAGHWEGDAFLQPCRYCDHTEVTHRLGAPEVEG
jgi:hypothetical protein